MNWWDTVPILNALMLVVVIAWLYHIGKKGRDGDGQ